MELGASHYLVNGGGGGRLNILNQSFKIERVQIFNSMTPAHFLKLSMTPTLYPKIKV